MRRIVILSCALSFCLFTAWGQEPTQNTINKWERKFIYKVVKFEADTPKEAFTYTQDLCRIFNEMIQMQNEQQHLGAAQLGAQVYSRLNELKWSSKFGTEYKSIYSNYEFYAWFLQRLSFSLNAQGFYSNALYYGLEAEKCWRQIKASNKKKDDAIDYMHAESTANLVTFYWNLRDLNEAKKWADVCVELTKGKPGYETLYYEVLNTEACLYDYEGLHEKALELEYMIVNTAPNVRPIWEENYINFLYNCDKKEGAIAKMEELIQKQKSQKLDNTMQYASYLNKLATYKQHYDVNESISLELEALDILKRRGNTLNSEYALYLNNLARFYFEADKKGEALNAEERAYNIYTRILPDNNPQLLSSLFMLSLCQYENHQWESATKSMIKGTKKQDDNIRYSMLQPKEVRQNIWKNCEGWYLQTIPRVAYHVKSDSLSIIAYNAALLSKGILLNTEQSLMDMAENGGPKSKQLYEKWQESLCLLNSPHSVESDELLRKTAQEAEENFVQNCRTLETVNKRLSVKWDDVQQKLGDDDIAIEFCSFEQDGKTLYMALVLNKKMHSPKVIPLFDEEQMGKIKDKYGQKETSVLIWKPLSEYLQSARDIYFAPSGELYNIAIEHLPHWNENCLMSDRWNIYRLSSTREMVLGKSKASYKQASIYGGIKYNVSTDVLVADSRKYSSKRSYTTESFSVGSLGNLRNGVEDLPASKIEVEAIDKALKQKGVVTKLMTDSIATESAIKNLSGTKTDLLHIATHGLFITRDEAKYRNDLHFLSLEDQHTQDEEGKALTRAGLLLAGANNALMGKEMPEGVDDGILTAREISLLDLRNLDMVVLSACQTGLGEITGDGVFGLQRGFKKAGANSIMMSLWNVDDEATGLLMTQFYKGLTSGMSKYESLRQAQKYVQGYKTEYRNPYYWAAFILTDAIY